MTDARIIDVLCADGFRLRSSWSGTAYWLRRSGIIRTSAGGPGRRSSVSPADVLATAIWRTVAKPDEGYCSLGHRDIGSLWWWPLIDHVHTYGTPGRWATIFRWVDGVDTCGTADSRDTAARCVAEVLDTPGLHAAHLVDLQPAFDLINTTNNHRADR